MRTMCLTAFWRSAGGVIAVIDAPGAGTGSFQGSSAVGINDSGMIVGTFTDTNNVNHAFVRAPGGTFTLMQ